MADQMNLSEVQQAYCHRLRCKEMFIDTGEPFDLKDSGSGIYWCSHTQNCLGPDGQIAHVEECKPGRACYETA
jgi:hypothetical protein